MEYNIKTLQKNLVAIRKLVGVKALSEAFKKTEATVYRKIKNPNQLNIMDIFALCKLLNISFSELAEEEMKFEVERKRKNI